MSPIATTAMPDTLDVQIAEHYAREKDPDGIVTLDGVDAAEPLAIVPLRMVSRRRNAPLVTTDIDDETIARFLHNGLNPTPEMVQVTEEHGEDELKP